MPDFSIPDPDIQIDLDLDAQIPVRNLLAHPLVERVFPAGMPWFKEDLVHTIFKGGVIQVWGKVYESAISTTPIPRYKPDFILNARGMNYFRGMTGHPLGEQRRRRCFYEEFIQAGVDTGLVSFIHTCILDHLEITISEAHREWLWLQIAAAVLRLGGNIPWLPPREIMQAATAAFGTFNWTKIARRGKGAWEIRSRGARGPGGMGAGVILPSPHAPMLPRTLASRH